MASLIDAVTVGGYTVSGSVVTAAAVFAALSAILWIFRNAFIHHLEKISAKTKNDFDDLLIKLAKEVPSTFYMLLSLYVGLQFTDTPVFLDATMGYAVIVVAVYYAIRSSQLIIDYFRDKLIARRRQADESEDVSLIIFLAKIVKYSMWFVGVLIILANMNVDISALIAGMGVGGIAIALAAQNILDDIFSSLSIYFDKPYRPGEFILIGDDLGVVQKIGIKTTRINTLRGEELVVSNKEMTSTRIHNFGRMPHRRVAFSFGVTYDTPSPKLKKIPDTVKSIIESQEMTRFDRAHFFEFGDSSLNYEVVYYVESPDYNKYMDIQQAINLGLVEAFEKDEIEFAFPTRTVHLVKE